jgi:hypothetical protein
LGNDRPDGEPVRNWKNFWPGKCLPGEYAFYQRQLLERKPKSLTAATGKFYLCFPSTWQEKRRLITHFLFNPASSAKFRIASPAASPLAQSAYVLKRLLKEWTGK